MDLTTSYDEVLTPELRVRYDWFETRNAARILHATNRNRFAEIVHVLNDFRLLTDDLLNPGGQESALAARLNHAFRDLGWREARVDTQIKLILKLRRYGDDGPLDPVETETFNEGYQVDNVLGRVALDVEWNAKDGNLDRDIGAYRALYDAGFIDCAVMITRRGVVLRDWAQELARVSHGFSEEQARRILGTTTTTNTDKLVPRMTRGDAGGCPLLVAAISPNTWEHVGAPPRTVGPIA